MAISSLSLADMIRRVINGIEVVETIKPVIAGDEGMVWARFFDPCECVREKMIMAHPSDRAGRASPEPVSRLGLSATIPCAWQAEQEALISAFARLYEHEEDSDRG